MIVQQQMQQQQQLTAQTVESRHRNSSTGNSVRLPKLEIPSFSGEKLKWTAFWDSFEAAIHLNMSLSDVEKLNYLMSKLTGEAKNAVSGILLSNENPADIASRGTSTCELRDNRMWWHGPEWLTQPQQTWPEWIGASIHNQKAEIQSDVESEYRKTKVMFEAKLVAREGPPE